MLADVFEEQAQRYAEDELLLARIGEQLFRQDTKVKVLLDNDLAEDAVRAWARDETGEGPLKDGPDERRRRGRAGTLALIGLAVEQRADRVDGGAVVELDAWLVGSALDAAEEARLLDD